MRPRPYFATLLVLLLAVLLAACSPGEESAAGEGNPQVATGERLFKQNCASCHSIKPNVRVVGPSLAGVGERAATRMEGLKAQEYIRLSILSPDAYVVEGFSDLMPKNFGNRFDDEQLAALTAYLMTLE